MSQRAIKPTQVNNFRILVQTYRINRIFCWHSKRNLRLLLASNGAEIYCASCGCKRFGYILATPPEDQP